MVFHDENPSDSTNWNQHRLNGKTIRQKRKTARELRSKSVMRRETTSATFATAKKCQSVRVMEPRTRAICNFVSMLE